MEGKEKQWNREIVELTNKFYNCYQDLGILLNDIHKSMLSKTVMIENHVNSESVWYDLGNAFFRKGDYSLSNIVYDYMIKTIKEYDRNYQTKFHKGLALYNLGISQLNQKNYDEGIPNIKKINEHMEKAKQRDFLQKNWI